VETNLVEADTHHGNHHDVGHHRHASEQGWVLEPDQVVEGETHQGDHELLEPDQVVAGETHQGQGYHEWVLEPDQVVAGETHQGYHEWVLEPDEVVEGEAHQGEEVGQVPCSARNSKVTLLSRALTHSRSLTRSQDPP